MRARLGTFACAAALCLLPAFSGEAQPDPGDGPATEPGSEEPGSLKERPDTDPEAQAWVDGLGSLRPIELSKAKSLVLHPVLSPVGDSLYFFRPSEAAGKSRFTLWSAGPESPERKILDCGAVALPPLFTPDGRLVLLTRTVDANGDGAVDALDDPALVVCRADGSQPRQVMDLAADEIPLALSPDGKEVYVAGFSRDNANGRIDRIDLAKKSREPLVRGFNVELVLDDGRLLIERLAPPPEGPSPDEARWGWRPAQPAEDDEPAGPRLPGLLDASEHVLFDPATGAETPLHAPGKRARLAVYGEGSFFGHQAEARQVYSGRFQGDDLTTAWELLIVDDETHRDTLAPVSRCNYVALAWASNRGLLALERARLGSTLMLLDRALQVHTLAEFDFTACQFTASANGAAIAFLRVDDTNGDGRLEPWKDESIPCFVRLPAP